MGLLSRAQEIFGNKVFREGVEFNGNVEFGKDVKFKQHITAYEPVAGEPSCGTLHLNAKNSLGNIVNADTSYNTWTTVDVSSLYPRGTKVIWFTGLLSTAFSVGGGYSILHLRATGSGDALNVNRCFGHYQSGATAVTYYPMGVGMVKLSSDLKFDFYHERGGTSGTSYVWLNTFGYFL